MNRLPIVAPAAHTRWLRKRKFCGLPPLKHYKKECARIDYEVHEKECSTKQILLHYVSVNKLFRYIALGNVFIYLARYHVFGWVLTWNNSPGSPLIDNIVFIANGLFINRPVKFIAVHGWSWCVKELSN